MSVNDSSRIVIDNSEVMLQIVASLPDDSRGIIYDHNMFKTYHRYLWKNYYCHFSTIDVYVLYIQNQHRQLQMLSKYNTWFRNAINIKQKTITMFLLISIVMFTDYAYYDLCLRYGKITLS